MLQEWKVAPLVDPEEELPDEMKSIFDGNVYRTHPLEIKSSTGRWCSDRRKWSAAVVTDEWERENSGRAEARVQQEEGIGEEEDEGEEEDPFSFGGDNSDWAWFNPDDDGASPNSGQVGGLGYGDGEETGGVEAGQVSGRGDGDGNETEGLETGE
uniref:Uncharacterized protein n=1 Tax=Chromera velia CCMP2878 TaxID=1169474 RepID=A0A0K6SAJ0_9ALVE|eukprot:Cvel_10926.t1-p1 / transcript=Cvel_10926.t1 / gene=Cvel_10926 / organism=Chromera_velia_CCMP2878 / gene_product=hypothetical protein / transcript_product=hypothetical protein / location=Cvel_scaffold671:55634-58779(+) / protein_length=154 / sequence_SO=supercontig / SO=protein_coding / is_pseudo=false